MDVYTEPSPCGEEAQKEKPYINQENVISVPSSLNCIIMFTLVEQ